MRRPRNLALIYLGVMVVLLGIAVSWVTWRANFFLLPFASITENGADSSGYIYGNTYRPSGVTHLLVTRQELGQKHSYLANVENDHGGPAVMDCEDWQAPHAPFFIFPDVNPPCIHWYAAEQVLPEPKTPKRNVVVGRQSLEFTANDGKRVVVRW